MSAGGGEQQCIHSRVAPPHGTEVNMMGVDRFLQSMTGGGERAGGADGRFQLYYTWIMVYTAYMCIYLLGW